MGVLTGPEIARLVGEGRIVVDPFTPDYVGPNSVDVRLGSELLVYDGEVLDAHADNPASRVQMRRDGHILEPGELYLGSTVESVGSDYYVPMLEGRSSVGRLGVQVHMTAGFGDVGFVGDWTLEITVQKRVRLYPGMRIAQVYFLVPQGELRRYAGKYDEGQRGPVTSRLWADRGPG